MVIFPCVWAKCKPMILFFYLFSFLLLFSSILCISYAWLFSFVLIHFITICFVSEWMNRYQYVRTHRHHIPYHINTEDRMEESRWCSSAEKGGSYVCKLAVCALRTSTLPHPHIRSVCRLSVKSELLLLFKIQSGARHQSRWLYSIFMLNNSTKFLVVKKDSKIHLNKQIFWKTKRNRKFQFKIEKIRRLYRGAFLLSDFESNQEHFNISRNSRQIYRWRSHPVFDNRNDLHVCRYEPNQTD